MIRENRPLLFSSPKRLPILSRKGTGQRFLSSVVVLAWVASLVSIGISIIVVAQTVIALNIPDRAPWPEGSREQTFCPDRVGSSHCRQVFEKPDLEDPSTKP
jgi:hypothetical protein